MTADGRRPDGAAGEARPTGGATGEAGPTADARVASGAMSSRPWAGRRLHILGIAGAGMSALAVLARGLGAEVTGSDRNESRYLAGVREAGIDVRIDRRQRLPVQRRAGPAVRRPPRPEVGRPPRHQPAPARDRARPGPGVRLRVAGGQQSAIRLYQALQLGTMALRLHGQPRVRPRRRPGPKSPGAADDRHDPAVGADAVPRADPGGERPVQGLGGAAVRPAQAGVGVRSIFVGSL